MISSGVNLVMTIIGFGVSTLFIVFICTRLIYARIQLHASRRRRAASSFPVSSRTDLAIVSFLELSLLFATRSSVRESCGVSALLNSCHVEECCFLCFPDHVMLCIASCRTGDVFGCWDFNQVEIRSCLGLSSLYFFIFFKTSMRSWW